VEARVRRLWTKRWFRALIGLLSLLFLAALLACWRFRVWSYKDYRTLREVSRYPIGEGLWLGQIQAGQDAEAFAAEHPPHRSLRVGRYLWMKYYTSWPVPPGVIHMESMTVIAKDERLAHASAGGCDWGKVFFSMRDEEYEEFHQAWERHLGR
jgi:hypothetical protein